MDQIKTTKEPPLSTIGKERLTAVHLCHSWHVPLADVGVERCIISKGCCVWEEERRKGKMWNGPNKNNKEPPLSTIGKARRTVSHGRHTWHVPLADVGVEQGSWWKGFMCLGGERRKCKMWNRPNKNNKGTTTINNWQGKTYWIAGMSHSTRPTCWCRRWTH